METFGLLFKIAVVAGIIIYPIFWIRHYLRKFRARDTIAQPVEDKKIAALQQRAAATWQSQAEESDRKWRAEIAARANRTIQPPTPADRALQQRVQDACLAFRHVFPPRHPDINLSFLGGAPYASDDLKWPLIHNREGVVERATFMAQIDCSAIPPGPNRDLLPMDGFLYFYAPLADSLSEEHWKFVCEYLPGPARKNWHWHDDPPALSVVEEMDGKRSSYNRVPIELGWVVEPTDEEVAERAAEGLPSDVANIIRRERLIAFHGEPVAADPLLSVYEVPKDQMWHPYPEFPHNWAVVRSVRDAIRHRFDKSIPDSAKQIGALRQAIDAIDPDDGEVDLQALQSQRARLDELEAYAARLADLSRRAESVFFPSLHAGIAGHEAVPDDYKRSFLQFLDQIRQLAVPQSVESYDFRLPDSLYDWMAKAAIDGGELGLAHPEGAAHVPRRLVEALRQRHSILRKWMWDQNYWYHQHQMFGEGDCVQVAAEEMPEEGYIMLLQLSPDEATGWGLGDNGVVQYWIAPADLAAKRFENCFATFESH